MFNKEYFKHLVSFVKLTEAGEEEQLPEEVPAEEQEAAPEEGTEMDQAPIEGEEDAEGLDDAGYMDQAPPPQTSGIDDATKREQKAKLFDEFTKLKKLAEFIKTSFEEKLSVDLIDSDQSKAVNLLFEKVADVVKKIVDYQLTTFIDRTYEESLYIYMLLRSELTTTLKYVRQVFGMNSNSKKEDESQTKEKE